MLFFLAQAAGHPLLGDEIYGVKGPWIQRQALHAAALSLVHPITGQQLDLCAPLHPDFSAALSMLGMPEPEVRGEGVRAACCLRLTACEAAAMHTS